MLADFYVGRGQLLHAPCKRGVKRTDSRKYRNGSVSHNLFFLGGSLLK